MWRWAAEVHYKVSAHIQCEAQCIVGSGGKQMVCAVAVWDDDRPLRDSSGSECVYRMTCCSPASPAARRRRSTSARFHLIYTHMHICSWILSFFSTSFTLFYYGVQTHMSVCFLSGFCVFRCRIADNDACVFYQVLVYTFSFTIGMNS